MTSQYVSWLRNLDDSSLTTLLQRRPDAVLPPPPGPEPLARRLLLRASVARALHQLTALDLAVLEVAADLGAELTAITATRLIAEVTARAQRQESLIDDPTPALDTLRVLGLLYPTDGGLRLVAEAMNALPGSLSILPARPAAEVAEEISALSAPQRRMLQSLAVSGGVGHSRDAAPDADPSRPIPSLISAGLLERIDSTHVRLPRAVARVVRSQHGTTLPLAAPTPASASPAESAVRRVDAAGAAQGLEMTRQVASLIDVLGTSPIALNKDHTVPARAAATLAKALSLTTDEVSRLVSLAAAAGLVATGMTAQVPEPLDPEANYLAPTREADTWLAADLPQRWARLLAGWLASPYAHFREGRLLDDDTRLTILPELRRVVLEQYTRLPAGVPLADPEILDHLGFYAPLVISNLRGDEVAGLVSEARTVGALAHNAATGVLRELLAGCDVVEVATAHTPAEVSQFIIQADMTIMVPGPLPHDLQNILDLIADVEAPGLAAMYRVTEASIRRGLDAGHSAEALTQWLAEHALGEVPQTVSYLVTDTARRHGGLRGGTATSYLRCTDEALLAEVMASPAAAAAELQQLAPTVVISALPLARVLAVLREHGFSPVAEDAAGATVDIRPEPARTYGSAKRVAAPTRGIDASRISAAVEAIRGRSRPSVDDEDAGGESFVATLQAAARGGRQVLISAVDKSGRGLNVKVKPLTVTGGQVDAIDEMTGRVHRFLIHRITNVQIQ